MGKCSGSVWASSWKGDYMWSVTGPRVGISASYRHGSEASAREEMERALLQCEATVRRQSGLSGVRRGRR